MSNQTVIETTRNPEAADFSRKLDRPTSFVSSVALTFGTRVLILAGSVGASIIVGRWLGPEGLGALAVLNVTVALALQLGSAGLPSATTYFVARDRSRVGPAAINALLFGLAVGLVIALAVAVLGQLKPEIFAGVAPRLVAIISVSIPFQLLTLLGLNVLLATDRITVMNLLEASSAALILANAFVLLVVSNGNLETLVTFNTIAVAVVALLTIWSVKRRIRAADLRPDMDLLGRMLSYGIKFYVSIVAGFVIFRADLLIVNRFRGSGEAGVYAVAAQISLLLMMLPGVVAALLFPRVASRQDAAAELTAEVTRHSCFAMVLICLAAAVGSFALPLIYGVAFADATVQLLIMLPGILLVSIESVLVQHFTGTGLPAVIPVFWLVTMAVNLALNMALIPSWGARAAAVNSTLSYALIFILVAWYFCRRTGLRPSQIFLLRSDEFRDFFRSFRIRRLARRGL